MYYQGILFTSVINILVNSVYNSKQRYVYLCQQLAKMDYENIFNQVREERLTGRYISPKLLESLLLYSPLKEYAKIIGYSEKGLAIHAIQMGDGPNRVLGWSQMHGNESTTTRALFDFLNFLRTDKAKSYLKSHTFCFIPMLNPDGAAMYTRENANGIDLNRDAQELSQSESRVLRNLFQDFKPDICLNLHDQRSIYGLSDGKPAILSFLAPAADKDLSITKAREKAISGIVLMNHYLQELIPGNIGRYDDSFNPDCVGDSFQSKGVPTILFEAGHAPGDYQRETTRKMVFYAFMHLFGSDSPSLSSKTLDTYFKIPENLKNYRDILLRNVKIGKRNMDIALQYEEVLGEGDIKFVPKVDSFGDLSGIYGHKELILEGESILINSHENVFVDEEIVTISSKSSKKSINI